MAGTTLRDGRYRLESVLGRGGMAIVWRARDLQLERDVAIKVISDVLASDPRFVRRFEREARLAAGLSHPNLVKVFDFSVEAERPFLVMEYVPGGTLAEARGRELDVDSLARELLDALAHIHAAGILHRDIKPGNVLLGAEGSPRLTDFGIARGDESSSLTQTGQVLGTLRYIAPEVAAGEPATPRSDLYSLGVMLGELQGRPSPTLASLLPRMAAQDLYARPASAAEVLAELDPTRPLPPTAGVPLDPLPPTAPLDTDATNRLATTPHAQENSARVDYRTQRPSRRPSDPNARPIPGLALTRNQAVAGGGALLAILAIIIVAAASGGSSKTPPIPNGATVKAAPQSASPSDQVNRLEQIVQSAPRRSAG